MIPIDTPCLESAALPGTMLSDSRDGPSKPDKDAVVTPGGPRRRDQVHPVKPGETVRRNPDGTFTVVPEESPADAEKKEKGK